MELSGFVKDTTGTAISGLTVSLRDMNDSVVDAQDTTDSDGYWEFNSAGDGILSRIEVDNGSKEDHRDGRVEVQYKSVCADVYHTRTPTALAISSNAITVTRSYHTVTGAGTVNTINGGRAGMRVVLQAASGDDVTFANEADNIVCATNRTLDTVSDTIEFIYNDLQSEWHMLSMSNNKAD